MFVSIGMKHGLEAFHIVSTGDSSNCNGKMGWQRKNISLAESLDINTKVFIITLT